MSNTQQLSGVGGWLSLVVVGLIILGPLLGLGRLTEELRSAEEAFPNLASNSAWHTYKQLAWTIFAATVAISISAGYRLWKIHIYESVRFAILALWLAGPAGQLAYIVAALFSFGLTTGKTALPEILVGLIGSCVVAGIWTAYLLRSARVKNTYSVQSTTVQSE